MTCPGRAQSRQVPHGVLFVVVLTGCSLCGCAGTQGATADDFRRIQRFEEDIEVSLGRARQGLLTTEEAVTSVCHAGDDICEIADSTRDADAILRCDSARRTCLRLQRPQLERSESDRER